MLAGIHYFRLHSLAEFVDAVHMLEAYASSHPKVCRRSLSPPTRLTTERSSVSLELCVEPWETPNGA